MKRYIFQIIITGIVFFQTVQAQDISKLTLPASPAFGILGFEPASIMRPTNVKSLATDILNSFDKDGKLLMNLGLEVTPYWLGSHPNLKMKDYLNPSTGQAILQSFSLSAATVKDSASGQNKLGMGFRFKLYNGKPVKNVESAAAILNLRTRTMIASIIVGVNSIVAPGAIDTRLKAISAIEGALVAKNVSPIIIDEFKEAAATSINEYTDAIADIQIFLTDLVNTWVNGDGYKDVQANVSDFIYQRKGLIVEFAGASGYNTAGNMSLEKIGFWGNASYYVSTDDFFSLTARYMHQNNDTTVTNFDTGLGFLKKTTHYNISIEGMFRWYRSEIPDVNINNQPIKRIEKDFTYRLAVQGSYMISKDISINLSIGKDFDSPFIAGSGFFSILGLNYSIFSKEPLTLKN